MSENKNGTNGMNGTAEKGIDAASASAVPDLMKLSAEKRFLMGLSDNELRKLLRIAACKGKELNTRDEAFSYELPERAKERLERSKSGYSHDNSSKNWVNYTEKLINLRFAARKVIGDGSDTAVYKCLKEECVRMNLPAEFASSIIPSVMDYMNTGHMKPILLVGPAGCGKTTGGKLLAKIIGLPYYLISSGRVDHGHGLYGEGSSFQAPDVGEFAKGIIETGSLNLVYIIDEVEKAPKNMNRTSISDELLSVTDGSVVDFRDNFLDYELPIKNSPIVLTANELEGIPEPLIDRCDVYRFYDVEPERMYRIVSGYAEDMLGKRYKDVLSMDMGKVENAVCRLCDDGVRSIRQHKSLIDGVLHQAYCLLLETGAERPMEVPDEVFESQIERLKAGSKTSLGF